MPFDSTPLPVEKIEEFTKGKALPKPTPLPIDARTIANKAIDLITEDNCKRWTRGTYARKRSGEKCKPFDVEAEQFCMMGALYHTAHKLGVPLPERFRSYESAIINANDARGKRGLAKAIDLVQRAAYTG